MMYFRLDRVLCILGGDIFLRKLIMWYLVHVILVSCLMSAGVVHASWMIVSCFSSRVEFHVMQGCVVFMGGEVIYMRQSIVACVLCGVTHVRHCFICHVSNNN